MTDASEEVIPSRTVFDRSLKLLFQDVPAAACRLAGVSGAAFEITRDDTAVNVPELRADHLFRILKVGKRPWEMHLEYQFIPDRRQLAGWIMKNSALNHQLQVPVVLVVIYLRRGGRKQFPNSCVIRGDGLRNLHRFETVKLWEHRDRILNGDLKELAPLLVLCEDNPVEETLRKERQIIRELPVAPEVRDHLLGIAMLLGARFFSESLLQMVFQEDIVMLKELSFVEKWLEECAAEARAEGEARGEAKGEAKGEARGEARGRANAARQIALQALRTKFHDLPDWLVGKVENADAAWCEALTLGVITAETLQDLLAQFPDARSSSRS